MNSFNQLFLLFLASILFSCGNGSEGKTSNFSINLESGKAEFKLGDTLQSAVKSKKEVEIDSIVYYLHETRLGSSSGNETFQHVFENEKLGKWELSASIYYEGEEEQISKGISLFNDSAPTTYTYRIIETYPHSPDAYTQGLEFHNDTLYEGTGQYGESSLRKVDFRTGEVFASVDLDDSQFGEGITILNDKIYQLTWKAGEGYIYDLHTLERTGSFGYNQSKEGWGLANDGERLYKSDGTEKIWILNAETLGEETYIQTLTNKMVATQLNELEWVDGKIYANTYQRDGVAIINPENGAIEGLINFQGLRDKLGNVDELDPVNDVLNGIAYNPKSGKLYVTGKSWDKLFEVEIVEK